MANTQARVMAKRKPLDPYTIGWVIRWHNKRRSALNWAGLHSPPGDVRGQLLAQAEAHENSARELRQQARALKPAKRTNR